MKLSDTQLIILSSAAQRDDGLATSAREAEGGAAKAAVTKLLDQGLLKEVRVKRGEPHWRVDENERPIGLKLTAGSAAIQVEDGGGEAEAAPSPEGSKRPRSPAARAAASPARAAQAGAGHRADAAKSGATLDDMVAATGWLPHTTRAALTGLRKKGHELAKSKNAEGQTVYRIEKAGAA